MSQFQNWFQIVQIYSGFRNFRSPFIARGKKPLRLTFYEVTDIQTLWALFCRRDYKIPLGCELVLDIGANIGIFSVFATLFMKAKKVIALEPVQKTYKWLCQNIEANNLSARTIPIQKGIGNTNGQMEIWLGSTSVHSCMYKRNNRKFESGEVEIVETISLERLFQELKIEKVDMCKMDCEGAEVEAIMNTPNDVLQRINNIAMEYHFPSNQYNIELLLGKLKSANFECIHHNHSSHLLQMSQRKLC
jgi:FkbM family methyltransferase